MNIKVEEGQAKDPYENVYFWPGVAPEDVENAPPTEEPRGSIEASLVTEAIDFLITRSAGLTMIEVIGVVHTVLAALTTRLLTVGFMVGPPPSPEDET